MPPHMATDCENKQTKRRMTHMSGTEQPRPQLCTHAMRLAITTHPQTRFKMCTCVRAVVGFCSRPACALDCASKQGHEQRHTRAKEQGTAPQRPAWAGVSLCLCLQMYVLREDGSEC